MCTIKSNSNADFFVKQIIEWGIKNYSDFPWRKTKNKWHALIAEIMLQRTRAEQVVPVFQSFCEQYQSPADYVRDKKTEIFKSLGLLWREREVRKLAEILSETKIPVDKKTLLSLPGIGDYIASAFRSLHLGQRDVIIDSNVVRIYGRFFGFKTDGETRRKKWFIELASRLTPEDHFKDYNYGLIDYTRIICKPCPDCGKCILSSQCKYFQENG